MLNSMGQIILVRISQIFKLSGQILLTTPMKEQYSNFEL
jgi:hypothetical protein